MAPPVGTHGLIWYVMFCHGFPALAMLLVAMFTLFFGTMIARTPTALWAHICILICITQIPYYGLLPQFVAHRDRRRHLLAREPPRGSRLGGPMSTLPKVEPDQPDRPRTPPNAKPAPSYETLPPPRVAAEELGRDAAKRTIRAYGMATGDLRPLPDFLSSARSGAARRHCGAT